MTAFSFDPRTGQAAPALADSTVEDVDRAALRSARSAVAVAEFAPTQRARWLNAIADELEVNRDRLADIADEETGLGPERLTGELGRAAAALRFYGAVATEGSWLDATVDERTELRPDLRRVNQSLGPIAVFGASNFPFGFGVVGHDTSSALAAGCPVIVKAHPAHPRLSTDLADLVASALARAGAPTGAFEIVFGKHAGTQLVTHSAVRAIAFTGSEAGGLALWRLAATRDKPIPVYAEMGTVNCVVVTRDGAKERPGEIAAGFVSSFTLGMGQFCTKPGLILVPEGSEIPLRIADALRAAPPMGWLLTSGIAEAYQSGIAALIEAGATISVMTAAAETGWSATPAVLSVGVQELRSGSPLLSEVFGPVALVAEYAEDAQLDAVIEALPGSLAATVHGGQDESQVASLVTRLARKAGRVVVNGWPTGLALAWAQQHGGPWPATTIPSASSVGAAALARFVRPVAYQEVPESALPASLKTSNPWNLPRRLNGELVR